MINGNKQLFKCKINNNFYFIKLILAQSSINIDITSNSSLNKENAKYINNYTLSHFQEIDSYFKLFQTINEIYKNILKLLKKKKFFIIQNEDDTLSFILKIKIHDKIHKIKLSLSKYKNPYLFGSQTTSKETYIDNLNNEISNLRNRINYLEQNQNLFSYSNNYLPTNKFSNISDNSYNQNQLEKIIFKLNILENSNSDKDNKIKLLENQIKKYENKGYLFEEEDEVENEESNNNNDIIVNDNDDSYDNKNFNINQSKNSSVSLNNNENRNKIRRHNSFDKYNSINSDFIHEKGKRKQINKISNSYLPKDNNADFNFNKAKTIIGRNNTKNNNKKKNLSVDPNDYNYLKTRSYMPNSKAYKYLNLASSNLKENIENVDSEIISSKKELKLILRRIEQGEEDIDVKLKLLYRASSDGDFEEAIKFKCENKLITLTLFETMEGFRFGFYIEKRIKKTLKSGTKSIEIPGTSFLVGLNNLVYYNVNLKQNSLFYKNDNFLCFGYCSEINNNKTKWLVYTSRNNFIGKKYLFGDKNDVYLNLNSKKIIGDNLAYHIKDVEIFEVIIKYRN